MKKIKVLNESIDPVNFPILYQKALKNLPWLEEQVKSVADKWHEGSIRSALVALESDLQGSTENA